jgi:hypothetical protein
LSDLLDEELVALASNPSKFGYDLGIFAPDSLRRVTLFGARETAPEIGRVLLVVPFESIDDDLRGKGIRSARKTFEVVREEPRESLF